MAWSGAGVGVGMGSSSQQPGASEVLSHLGWLGPGMASGAASNSNTVSSSRDLAGMLGSPGEGQEGSSLFLQPVGLISTLTGIYQAGIRVLSHKAQD